jgi:RNA polymerase sigma-70 factor, ECF subfamily
MRPDRDVGGRDSGTEDAFTTDELVASVRVLVQRYCRARLGGYPGGAEAAEEVADEVSLSAVEELRGRAERGAPLAAVVFSLASHRVAEVQRRLGSSSDGGAAPLG